MDAISVGIDVGKDSLVVARYPTGERWTSETTAEAVEALVTRLRAVSPTIVIVEATGGYERAVVASGAAAGLPMAVINPRQVRAFAQALGRTAKTDAIDAAVICCLSRVAPKARGRGREVESMADTPISCMVVTSFPSGSA